MRRVMGCVLLVCLIGCGDTTEPETETETEDNCGPVVVPTEDWSEAVVGTQSPADVVASLAGDWTAQGDWSDGVTEAVTLTFADTGSDLSWVEHPDLPSGAPLHVCDTAGTFTLTATLSLADRGWSETVDVDIATSENMAGLWSAYGGAHDEARCGVDTSCGAILNFSVNHLAGSTDSFDAIIHFRLGEQDLLAAAVEGEMFTFTRVP